MLVMIVPRSIHYNLLSGELLVNGLPLDQPPQRYRAHPLYSTLFGKTIVEIMPSTTSGFQFSVKREFGGCTVQLRMSSNGEPIVRATKGDITYETIPSRLVEEAYPNSFVHDYVHWFNTATNTIQFRPVHESECIFTHSVDVITMTDQVAASKIGILCRWYRQFDVAASI